jgi:VanZ family protein
MGEPGTGDNSGSGLAPGRPRPAAAVWLWFALAVAVNLIVVFWPSIPAGAPRLFPHADKLAHAAVFAAVAYTGRRARLPLVPLVLALTVHAVESELVQQYLLSGRSGDPADSVADLIGMCAGCVLPVTGFADRLTL